MKVNDGGLMVSMALLTRQKVQTFFFVKLSFSYHSTPSTKYKYGMAGGGSILVLASNCIAASATFCVAHGLLWYTNHYSSHKIEASRGRG